MILLDTNVVSEPMKPRSDPRAMAWLNAQSPESLYLNSTSLAELLVGIETMPAGRRRDGMDSLLRELLDRFFGPRILPFDERAAFVYAKAMAEARSNGYTISLGDGQIVSVALASKLVVATRDTGPFEAAGVKTINPWVS